MVMRHSPPAAWVSTPGGGWAGVQSALAGLALACGLGTLCAHGWAHFLNQTDQVSAAWVVPCLAGVVLARWRYLALSRAPRLQLRWDGQGWQLSSAEGFFSPMPYAQPGQARLAWDLGRWVGVQWQAVGGASHHLVFEAPWAHGAGPDGAAWHAWRVALMAHARGRHRSAQAATPSTTARPLP
jgi:hypothetical protein